MPKYKLIIEYDGTNFVGWQNQDNGKSIQQSLEEAIEDISPAESAMGTVYVDGVEILGQGKQDRISAAANAVVEVARYSWMPIYSSATMFCIILSSYI